MLMDVTAVDYLQVPGARGRSALRGRLPPLLGRQQPPAAPEGAGGARTTPVGPHRVRRSGPSPTGSSARCGTCSASASTATPICAASSCTRSSSGHPLRKDYPINRRQPLIGPNVARCSRRRPSALKLRTERTEPTADARELFLGEGTGTRQRPASPRQHRARPIPPCTGSSASSRARRRDGGEGRRRDRLSAPRLREGLRGGPLQQRHPLHGPAELRLPAHQQLRLRLGGGEAARHRDHRAVQVHPRDHERDLADLRPPHVRGRGAPWSSAPSPSSST